METRFKKWSKTERFLAFYDREAERKVELGECLSRLKNSTHRDLIGSVLKEQSIMKYQAEAFSFEYACRVPPIDHTAASTLPAPETINFYVEPSEGHDDFLISLAVCVQALENVIQPAVSERVKPRPFYPGESRY